MLTELDIDRFIAQKSDFSLLIDARSPKEFLESHIPQAYNYYALSDAEHHEVGLNYKQNSRGYAKVLGAHYICQNVASYLLELAKHYPIGSKIGIYCAKGGLRSSSIAIILSQIGYQVFKLKGGYKSYRNYVLHFFEHLPRYNFIVLGGNTGCGKSELLAHLEHSIDLEKLANHFGSTFGAVRGKQPSQKSFENNLFEALLVQQTQKYLFIEAESKRIGKLVIPTSLYEQMKEGIRIEVTAPLVQRVERILKDYCTIDDDFFFSSMQTITPYIKSETKQAIIDAYGTKDLITVAQLLLIGYYDIVYKKPQNIDFKLHHDNTEEALAYLNSLHVKLSKTQEAS